LNAGLPGTEQRVKIPLKVVPGSSRSCIAGWLGESVKVRVKAPPESGKANKAVEKLLAKALQIPLNRVSIVRGGASPRKLVEITGLRGEEIVKRLSIAGLNSGHQAPPGWIK